VICTKLLFFDKLIILQETTLTEMTFKGRSRSQVIALLIYHSWFPINPAL